MSELVVTFPDDSVASLHVALEHAAAELKMLAAVKAYELDRMSSSAAARLAGVPRTVFLQKLGEYGVDTFRLNAEEIDRETPLV